MARHPTRWSLAAAVALCVLGAAVAAATSKSSYPPAHFFTRDFTDDGRRTGAPCASVRGAEIGLVGWKFDGSQVPDPVLGDRRVTFTREPSVVRTFLSRVGLRFRSESVDATNLRRFTVGEEWWTEWVRTEPVDDGEFTTAPDLAGIWRIDPPPSSRSLVRLCADGAVRDLGDDSDLGTWDTRDDLVVFAWRDREFAASRWIVLAPDRRTSEWGGGLFWSREP